MKKAKRLWLVLGLIGIGAYQAGAAIFTWSGGAAGGAWASGGSWVGGVIPANSISTDKAQFSTTTSGRMPTLSGNRSINGMTFDTRDWTVNSSAGLVLTLGSGGITLASQRTLTLETLIATVNNQSWTTTGSAVLNVNKAVIANNNGIVTKAGGGTMNINAGFSVSNLNITAGYIALGASDLLGDSMTLSSTAGNVLLNGFSDTLGTLSLAGSFAVNFGTNSGANALSFADSSALNWGTNTFYISAYEDGVDSLRFGTSAAGLTQDQLNRIQFSGKELGATIDENGFVTAVPEPATIGLLGVGTLITLLLRRYKIR